MAFFLLAGVIPPAGYYLHQRVPSADAETVKKALEADSGIIILDVRESSDYEKGHIDRAVNIPYPEFLKGSIPDSKVDRFRSKTVYVICSAGISSVEATRILRGRGIEAISVRGGMEGWILGAGRDCSRAACSFRTASGETRPPAFRELSSTEQSVAVFSGFAIKPFYTLLSLVLFILLWRRNQPELKVLKWSLAGFFVGENFCAANFLLSAGHDLHLLEYLHASGMAVAFAVAVFALFEGLDRHIIRYSDTARGCALTGLCRSCIKHQPVACGLERCFILLGLAGAVVSLMPVVSPLGVVSYNTEIFGSLYNYSHPVIYQIFEMRYYPALASVLFATASLILMTNRQDRVYQARIPFSAGAGLAGFSIFRFLLFSGYRDNLVWMDFWEETTELIFIVSVATVLFIFRKSLFPKPALSPA